jgi:hypothetical protein
VADAFGFPREAMLIDVEIGVQKPELVNTEALIGIFPYGQPSSLSDLALAYSSPCLPRQVSHYRGA